MAAKKTVEPNSAEAQRQAVKSAYRAAIDAFFRDARFNVLLGDQRVLLIDGGAKGGIQKEWFPAMPLLEVIGFDPIWPKDIHERSRDVYDVGAASAANVVRAKRMPYPPDTTFVPKALGSAPETRTILVSSRGSMSSFLRPHADRVRLYGLAGDAEVVATAEVETTTLDRTARDRGLRFIDFVKLDTQGTELEVLQGGEGILSETVFGLRVEACFVPLYEDQPLFAEVDRFVRQQGFEFIDLTHMKRYRRTFGPASETLPSDPGQLVVADPLYFRAPPGVVARLRDLDGDARRRYMGGALVACLIYGRGAYVIELLAAAGDLLDPEARTLLEALVRDYPQMRDAEAAVAANAAA